MMTLPKNLLDNWPRKADASQDCILSQTTTDASGVSTETKKSFSRTDLEKFKVQLDLFLKLDLPIKLPAVELHTKTAYDFCLLVSAFQRILKGGVGAVKVIASTGSQLVDAADSSSNSLASSTGGTSDDAASVTSSTASGDATDSSPPSKKGGLLGSLKASASSVSKAASKVASSAKSAAGKAFSALDKIADLVNFVLQKPVDVFAELLIYLTQGIQQCDTLSASFATKGGINPLQAPLLLSMSIPPSPVKPVLTVTVKDTFSVCAMAEALSAAAGDIGAHLDEDAVEDDDPPQSDGEGEKN